ncbi:flagellar type III secretion system pore protein FliP [Acetobacterium wieringae]|uniref:flagellar type III secretion system pore protein FliP n=1 Tax=Acetobacterium wieringae TaxID=52694 RepID=UPI0020338AB9|nr:flagellar type III secretion system pore protein FliP [Acetobacterium wieringae]URN85384.1 flagellar type III secretion system pore protein FliP [Acetobacterium wieringae]
MNDLIETSKNRSVRLKKILISLTVLAILFSLTAVKAYGAELSVEGLLAGESSDTVKIIVLMTLIAIVPTLLLMMTCFGRIIIVLSFLRNALGLQQTPPNQILVGLALAITFFVMSPVLTEINEVALQPYNAGTINTQQFLDLAVVPIKEWMLMQTTTTDVDLFKSLAIQAGQTGIENVSPADLPMTVVIPAFIISELKRAFLIGFLLFIPFLIIDMIVSSVLMSMGMMMLPPVMISMPFKLMLFVVVDGWGLLVKTLIMTYN